MAEPTQPDSVQLVRADELDERGSGGASGAMTRATAFGLDTALWVGTSYTPERSRTPVHHHGDQATVVYVAEGECTVVEVRGEDRIEHRGRAGDFLFVPPRTHHFEESAEGTRAVVIRTGNPPIVENLEAS